ncbi:pseudouridine synthase [Clostridium intestinale]|uniref:Pseudouridine synthase n=1 Tax=Clostridium intestinale URNW TaxID=1294142 RepID=U2Q236_9CLOT|nr:pseudouridine synthase [Clostridium intestinale]ERK30109.1 ribosomal large subunit pseudouridine synthase B [Clostridium intestinale URNW]
MEERLQKYMARCGVASRRKCEEFILTGKVSVNGVKILELGTKIDINTDKVYYNGNLIKPEEIKRYIMLNKPTGIITSVKDEKNRKTVIDLIDVEERIYPIGRLDYDSSGLLLLTNDGDLYNNIIHPRKNLYKTYIAKVVGSFTNEELEKFKSGVDIGGYITAPCKISVISSDNKYSKVKISIMEGKNRQIRKMCSAFNHEVIELKRISIGNIKLDKLEVGKWRELSAQEVDYIKTL